MLQKKRRSLWLALMVLILLLAGCGEKKAALTDGREVYVKEDKTEKPEESDEPKEVSAISEETPLYTYLHEADPLHQSYIGPCIYCQ